MDDKPGIHWREVNCLDAGASLWLVVDENVKLQNDCINSPRGSKLGYLLLVLIFLTIQSRSAGTNGASAAAPNGRTKKVRVRDPWLAEELLAKGGRLIADYGSFQILQVDEALAGVVAAQPGVEDKSEENVIALNASRLDTTVPEVKALRKPVLPGNGKRLHLVHFAGPIKPEWREALEQNDVEIVSYIPHNAYLV